MGKNANKNSTNTGVRWVPFYVTLKRRLQTLAVTSFWAGVPISLFILLALLLNPFMWWFVIPYLIFVSQDQSPKNGGRPLKWYKKLRIWNNFRDYFPVSLHKTADLDPKKNYVFGYHPHGIISLGAFTNFGTDSTGFSEKFPGIDLRLLTLASNFNFPFYREHLLSQGLCDVSLKSCNNILSSGAGKSIMIVIGGAAEALDAHPGTNDLTLGREKRIRESSH